jgi:hypothetical protein
MTTLRVAIMTHASRSYAAVDAAVRAQGFEPHIALSTHRLTREPRWKYLGIFQNFTGIMRWSLTQPADWVVILHDDVILPAGAIEKMRHVLTYASRDMVSFYNPDNHGFRTALSVGHHVLETAANYWTQCFCFRRAGVHRPLDWADAHVIPGILSEDRYLHRYCTRTGDRVQVVLPSFVQHDLNVPSTYRHAPVMGRVIRRSATYDPTFDPYQVDWARAFAGPYYDGKRDAATDGLQNLEALNA